MLLWVCFAILTASVVALLLRPLKRAQEAAVEPAAADLAVYRDQLRELEAERERGLVVESELESARAEVARRLLKRAGSGDAAGNTAQSGDDTASRERAQRIYLGVAALLPLLAIGLYLASGSPQLSGHPFAERQTADEGASSIVALIAKVEERLREHPEDGKGWDVIAPIYLRLGRYADAAHAFAEANRLEGESVRRLLGFAEATLMAENGIVSEAVQRTALRILTLEPQRIEVGVWLALAKEQDGDLAAAAAGYRELLAKAPENAQWRAAVSERLDLVTKKLAGEKPGENMGANAPAPQASGSKAPVTSSAEPNAVEPSSTDPSTMSPEQREAFILSMVNRLAARLKENGKDAAGWIRLARAYKVLGRDQDALSALASARENLADDKAALDEIAKAEQGLDQIGKEPSPQ
jgi:cytochrome c-type biogenesis protein CcmH